MARSWCWRRPTSSAAGATSGRAHVDVTPGSTLLGLGKPPWIVGHRGAAGERLENTLASLALAAEQGADLVEIDVQLTADGRLAVFHDHPLDRLAGRAGAIETLAWSELRAVPLGGGERIPELPEVLARLRPGLPVNIELKRFLADPQRLVDAICDALAGAPRAVLVSS